MPATTATPRISQTGTTIRRRAASNIGQHQDSGTVVQASNRFTRQLIHFIQILISDHVDGFESFRFATKT